ncbi:MAG: metallophosphoesterase [Candidatus Woesearchaeota archaeon]|nr:metallophosphoesterase [Candidatus Woesearchaeota archaeon]
MEISKGIEIIDLGLKIGRILVVADLHIGFEESLNRQGMMIPRFHLKDMTERLEKMIRRAKPDTIIVNGDIKHEMGTISDQEWRETLKVLELLARNSKKVILIKGNHDKILGPIARKKDIDIVESYEIKEKGILILHGHKEINIPRGIKTIIIGHEHPAVALKEGERSERFKCFLKGRYKGKDLIVLPSFNLLTEGTDILKEGVLSPFLKKQNLDSFEAFVVSDKIYNFGKLKDIERYNR